MTEKMKSCTTFSLAQAGFCVDGRVLLHPQNVAFPVGKFCALIGHNGSGKSTLLKLLGRHQDASCGSVLLNDRTVAQWPAKSFAREVAYLPQALPIAEGLTVMDLVSIGRYPWHGALGRFGAKDEQIVNEAITLTGLEKMANRLVDSLSGGEKQRAWIAMLLAQHSQCLLLDEPTSALDIAHQADILALLQRLCQQKGLTVIAVLHDINMAARYCDFLYALREGQLIANGTPHEIMTPAVLNDIYGIPMGTFSHPEYGHPVSFIH